MFNDFTLVWVAIIGLVVMITISGVLLAGMYDSMRMRVKELEKRFHK